MAEAKPPRAVRQGRLCDCPFLDTGDGNPWHSKQSICPSVPELTFYRLVVAAGLPAPEREYRFHPVRRWRFDAAWPEQKLAVEVMGGVWNGGRHARGAGYEQDAEKQNTAIGLGWRLLRFTPSMLKDGTSVVGQVRDLLESP